MSPDQQSLSDEDGQDVVEYGLLIATVSLLAMLGTTSFASVVGAWFAALATKFTMYVGA
jgi:Flp pilus assembly pilin Flp